MVSFNVSRNYPFDVFQDPNGTFETLEAARQEFHRRNWLDSYIKRVHLYNPATSTEIVQITGLYVDGIVEVALNGYLANRADGVVAGIVGGVDIVFEKFDPETFWLERNFVEDNIPQFFLQMDVEWLVTEQLGLLLATIKSLREGDGIPDFNRQKEFRPKLGALASKQWPYRFVGIRDQVKDQNKLLFS